ncbi:DUF6049 family protein [Aeromicrobium yanjiei]|uniref:Glycoprotein n=1 Tax=Aeromicrobium yanjiei TaxID=2662028 RepID=A0A5Q2MJ46_9ACTN|nr:DUF6049 family protein [Aeromicrobium yanjiei]QGG43077.1 hypothetical protein GEV26_17770 [Aeromicrobium yanjiei]
MSSPRRTILVALLVTILGAVLAPVVPAQAAGEDPDLQVSIRSLDPSRLTRGADVTMTGTVTNRNDHAWTAAQVYLVIPASPFTTRAQVDEAMANSKAYTGVRVVETGAFDELGDLAPSQTKRFRISVPYEQLGITGAEGVYPVGVQVLATDTDGSRSPEALAGATTTLPLISSDREAVPTSILWPFLMTDTRTGEGTYARPDRLLRAVSPGGQLRNLLDLASGSSGGGAGTALVDPALLVGVDDLANARHLPDDLELTDEQRAGAASFLEDLLQYARTHSPWILGYDRPDVLALAENPDLEGPLVRAIDRATDTVLAKYQLSGRRVSWPTRDGVTRGLLSNQRGSGDSPVIVSSSSLPDWEPRLGSLVQYTSAKGPLPLLVNDPKPTGSTGPETVLVLRQRVLSDAALAVLERAIDPDSRADSFTMVDPQWDPGVRWSTGQLSTAFTVPFTRATSLDALLTQRLVSYKGDVPTTAEARPLSRAQVLKATEIVEMGATLSSIISQSADVDDTLAREVASVLGVRWRLDRSAGLVLATSYARRISSELDKISIEAPPSVTLSSSKGGFPLTIRNDTDEAIRIGVDLDSSNPALTIPTLDDVDVAAGERRTITVQVDLGRQRTTFLTAHLVTANGTDVGSPTTFKVRSSSIGTVLWVAMGLAALFVLAALVRRFHRRRTASSAMPVGDDDD